MATPVLKELLLQSLTCEKGGVTVYETALAAVRHAQLRKEWRHYLEQTRRHVALLTRVIAAAGLDPGEITPGCRIVHHQGKALVAGIQMALAEGDPVAAQIVASEAVLLAETKDRADWELLAECADDMDGPAGEALRAALAEVREEEEQHFLHSRGWSRELWLKALGRQSMLPPPQETEGVTTASEAEAARRRHKDR
jgi:rubrerythrin